MTVFANGSFRANDKTFRSTKLSFSRVKNFINSLESGKIMVKYESPCHYLTFGDNDDEGHRIGIGFTVDSIVFIYCHSVLLEMYDNGNYHTTGNETFKQTNN